MGGVIQLKAKFKTNSEAGKLYLHTHHPPPSPYSAHLSLQCPHKEGLGYEVRDEHKPQSRSKRIQTQMGVLPGGSDLLSQAFPTWIARKSLDLIFYAYSY